MWPNECTELILFLSSMSAGSETLDNNEVKISVKLEKNADICCHCCTAVTKANLNTAVFATYWYRCTFETLPCDIQ